MLALLVRQSLLFSLNLHASNYLSDDGWRRGLCNDEGSCLVNLQIVEPG
jgi:hypothetical protein